MSSSSAVCDEVRRTTSFDHVPSSKTTTMATSSTATTTANNKATTATMDSVNNDTASTSKQMTDDQHFDITNCLTNGENFSVKGKRLSMDGRIEYLIEWEGNHK